MYIHNGHEFLLGGTPMSTVKGSSMRLILIVVHTELQSALYLECCALNLQGLNGRGNLEQGAPT